MIHLVMPPVIVFMYTHLGVASGDSSSHKCRDLSDSPRHASSVLLRVRRSQSRDYETPEIVFMYRHVGVSSGDSSRHKC